MSHQLTCHLVKSREHRCYFSYVHQIDMQVKLKLIQVHNYHMLNSIVGSSDKTYIVLSYLIHI